MEFEKALSRENTPVVYQPDNAFHRRTLEVVSGIVELEMGGSTDDIRRSVLAITESILHLADYLSMPRSFDDFQKLKEQVIKRLIDKPHIMSIDSKTMWLYFLSYEFGIIPNVCEISNVKDFQEAWESYERVTEVPFLFPNAKVISENDLPSIAETARQEEVRIGLTGGKFRIVHSEHNDLFLRSKEILGPDSIYLILLETSQAIVARRGQSCLPDEERLRQLASRLEADYVCLVDPRTEDIDQTNRYYEHLWKLSGAQFYLFGSREDALTPVFLERSRRLGVIPLWARDNNTISSTKLCSYLFASS